ncbi:putative ABC transporter extracellular-binding protein YurO [Clostridia bacterium]|nr:putative ABC transporter extracellular-binding protein YurO [Clostridia bacterium]
MMRKRIFKKVLFMILCSAILLGSASCAPKRTASKSTGTSTRSSTESSYSSSGSSSAGGQTGSAPVTLNLWHIWGSGDSNSDAVSKVISDYEARNPNVKIKVQTFENDAYKTTIRTSVSDGTAPDVFSTWGGGFSKAFVDSGKVLKLDDSLNDGTLSRVIGGALTNFTYDGSVYGLTFGMSCSGFFCNTALFDKYNLELPETWDELLSDIEVFKENGVIPISTTFKERWVIGMLFEAIALKAVGAEQLYPTLTKTGGTFSDPQYLNAANRLMELVDAGAFNEDASAISRDEAEVSVKNGEAAMYYMGSWASGTVEADDSVDKGKFKFIPFPTLPDGNGKATEFNGGGADGLMISSTTKNPKEAVAFLKYLAENLAREDYQEGNYLPLWKDVKVDESKINPVTLDIVGVTSNATDFILWWDTLMEGEDITTYQDALDSLILKQITPEQFVEELKTIQP